MSPHPPADYVGDIVPTWCPFCGDYYILTAVQKALSALALEPEDVVLVSGIGCGSKLPHYVKAYGFEGLHGRTLPVATGVKLANHRLTVIALGGDGDGYGIGGNHLLNACRRNLDITYLVQNNAVYGLTKGQYSPTSQKGTKGPTTPEGSLEVPVNPLALALTAGATFIARAYSNDVAHLTALIVAAVRHKGFALVDIFQPCTTYNLVNTPAWYKAHTYKLEEKEPQHDRTDKEAAFRRCMEHDPLPLGVIYQVSAPTYEDGVSQIKASPLVEQDAFHRDITPLLAKWR